MDNNQMKKRYGLFTAICMVVGIVIGSGVFFKAEDILSYTGGNMLIGILAWIIGGAVMIICAFNFANFATRYLKVNGVVDYAESIVGPRYAYMTGWFLTTIYYPAMTSVLAWVSARYTLVLFDPQADITSGLCMALGCFYLCLAYSLNVLSPKLAGKFQISATVIKLIPLGVIMVVGITVGLINGNTTEAFAASASTSGGNFDSVFAGVGAAAFAYEGWIIATSINSELKNAKKNLPLALVIGTAIIMAVYIIYFVGLTGGASISVLGQSGGATKSFIGLFGNVGNTVIHAFIVVSCLGTLNGLMLANTRSLYSLSVRGNGPAPNTYAQLDPQTNMPSNSSALTLLFCGAWFFYFYGANLTNPIFGPFSFDSSELPIITAYALYIPIFIIFIKKEGKQGVFKNVIMPILAIIASLFMIFVAVYAHGITKHKAAAEAGKFAFPVLFYLIVFAVVMAIGALLYKSKKEK